MTATVLIVDDSLTVRMDLAEAFAAAGFQALLATTVAEARRALAGSPIDVVILDVMLPDGDGVELLSEIRASATGESPAVLMLSSEAEVKDRIRGLKRGADDYIGKPYDDGYVVAKARELIRARSSEAPGTTAVLLIDDSVTYREALRPALKAAGYRVLMAETGEQGLRMAADQRPGAILADGRLPGIDGATLIRRIRLDEALRGIPCVLLTAAADRESELTALEAGADAYVPKEAEIDVLLAKLAAAMRSATAPRDGSASLLGPKKILVAHGEPRCRAELSAALRGDGCDVVLVSSGEEALELIAVEPVDCILLEVQAQGPGGFDICRRIKGAPIVRDTPLMLIVPEDGSGAIIEALRMGADDCIARSSELEVLKARVRAQLRRKQFQDEKRRLREELLRKELEASEARAARELAEARAHAAEELERKNRELEAFSYSVSHDLRAPLRVIDGFSRALIEDCAEKLDEHANGYLERIRASAKRMAELIDDLLKLSRVSRAELNRERVSLSELAQEVCEELHSRDPERVVELVIAADLCLDADRRLMRVLLDNLLGNAWKFTAKRSDPRIELGCEQRDAKAVYFVRDNGAGFNMEYAEKLFHPFQRLHSEAEFPGTGIGLATVYRVVDRHGGRVWAEGAVGEGATVFFSVPGRRSGGSQ